MKITIKLGEHGQPPGIEIDGGELSLEATLQEILRRLKDIETTQRTIMTQNDTIQVSLAHLNDATNKIATSVAAVGTEVQALKDKVQAGMTDAEAAAIRDQIEAQVGKLTDASTALESMGTDPSAPLPPPGT